MSYLSPPPDMSPVVVVRDYGGYVDQYEARTAEYRRTGREVRIHECHSACTLALSLPTACVYRDAVLKFHQAYDPTTKVRDTGVSATMFGEYPGPVRERLGTLTRDFRVLRGPDLIAMGIRECGRDRAPASPVVVASRSAPDADRADRDRQRPQAPAPTRVASVPLPPPRPTVLASVAGEAYVRPIPGSAPVMPARFVPFGSYGGTVAMASLSTSDDAPAR